MAPALIDEVAALLSAHTDASMGTAAHPIASQADYLNPNVVKVVLDARNMAHYFSRAPIPWSRDQSDLAWWRRNRWHLPCAAPSKLCTAAPRRHLQLPGRFSEAVSAAAPAPTSCRGTGAAQGPVAWPPHCRPYRRHGPWPQCDTPKTSKSPRYFGVAGPSPLSRVQGRAQVPSVSQSQTVTCYPCPPQEHGILDAGTAPPASRATRFLTLRTSMRLILLGAPGAGRARKPPSSARSTASRKSLPAICSAQQSRRYPIGPAGRCRDEGWRLGQR